MRGVTLLRNLRAWFSTPRRRLGGAALAVLVLGGLSGGLAVALSGGDDQGSPVAQAAANAGDTPGTTADAGTAGAGDTSSPGDASGTAPGTAGARGTRTPRPGGTPSRQQNTGEKPSVTLPTLPEGFGNFTPGSAPPPQETATVKPPTPTPTPRTVNFVSAVTPPPPSGRSYCDTSGPAQPPNGRVAGVLKVNGGDAPPDTNIHIAFDGTVGPAAKLASGGYSVDVWPGGNDCANRPGAAIYVVVNGKWFPTGHNVGELGLFVADIQL